MRAFGYFIFFVLAANCVEPYDFVIDDVAPALVIEGYVSDQSFNETLEYPSDGRFFTVRLSMTSPVTNTRAQPVSYAEVKVVNSEGEEWQYLEVSPGIYQLMDFQFKAQEMVEYKLVVTAGTEVYESNWQRLPEVDVPAIGEIGFEEQERETYVIEAGKPELRSVKVVTAHIAVGKNSGEDPIYYRWFYSPLWVYKAPLAPVMFAGKTCWVTDPFYLNNYTLQIDRSGDYKKELFSMPTIRNERLYENFSVLVTQQALNKDHYNFYREMMERNEGSALMEVPPYNLQTNIHAMNPSIKVYGYFGVVKEQAKRWYFNRKELSYNVINTLRADCLVDYGPGGPAPECLDCRAFSRGQVVSNIRPTWWFE